MAQEMNPFEIAQRQLALAAEVMGLEGTPWRASQPFRALHKVGSSLFLWSNFAQYKHGAPQSPDFYDATVLAFADTSMFKSEGSYESVSKRRFATGRKAW